MDDMTDWEPSMTHDEVTAAHAAGKVVVGGVGHIYETAWQIRGYEQFLMDLVERPAWAECLLERLAHNNMVKCTAFAKTGADLLHCGDDVANQRALMFSPPMWRRMLHSRWARIWRTVTLPVARVVRCRRAGSAAEGRRGRTASPSRT